jgi:hypothetical protein
MMKKKIHPGWSKKDQLKGKRMHQAWEQFFSEKGQAEKTPGFTISGEPEDRRLSAVFSQHEAALMKFPNVIGVAEGIRTRSGKPTGERCLVVYVSRKIPRSKLRRKEILPPEVDGVPVDVMEVGTVEPLPL